MLNKITKNKLDVVYGSRVLKNSKFKNVQNFSHWARIFGNIFLTFYQISLIIKILLMLIHAIKCSKAKYLNQLN